MAAWVAAAADAGIADAAIMPDALALPVPGAGRWNVRRESDGRILVRTPEGSGFAAMEALFVALWTAAGKPTCDEVADTEEGIPIVLDLRQGDFARPRQGLSATGRRVAIVAAAGLIAHGAIAAADTVALRSVRRSVGPS
jgi:general secretion pathway protein L